MDFTVGRTEQADQTIPGDTTMSSLHFQLKTSPQGCEIRDLGSTNGTFVNGQRVQFAQLSTGDIITAGDTRFELRVGGSATDLPTRPPDPLAETKPAAPRSAGPELSRDPPPTPGEQRAPATAQPADDSPGQDSPSIAVIEIEHPLGVKTVTIRQGTTYVFGRTEYADVAIPDDQISAVHFSIVNDGTSLAVRDLGSSNGTFCSGERIQATQLVSGSCFTAGNTTFQVLEFRSQPDSSLKRTAIKPLDHSAIPAVELTSSQQRISLQSRWPYEKRPFRRRLSRSFGRDTGRRVDSTVVANRRLSAGCERAR